MAIANYKALSELLNEGDYNVRLTAGRTDNKTTGAFRELIRDSLGHGILDSDEEFVFKITGINKLGFVPCGALKVKGKELIERISADSWLDDIVAIRIDRATKTAKRS